MALAKSSAENEQQSLGSKITICGESEPLVFPRFNCDLTRGSKRNDFEIEPNHKNNNHILEFNLFKAAQRIKPFIFSTALLINFNFR